METPSSYARHNYDEHIAHVIWAAHILHYLSGERSQTGLLPELETDEDFEADESDVETQNNMIQTAPIDSVRSKFLDCVAELLSPSKGWDYVVSAGLRQSVECTEIDVARNDGFSRIVESEAGEQLVRDGNTWYIDQLQKYLASDEGTPIFKCIIKLEIFTLACLIILSQVFFGNLATTGMPPRDCAHLHFFSKVDRKPEIQEPWDIYK
jgi:hypothetical protein